MTLQTAIVLVMHISAAKIVFFCDNTKKKSDCLSEYALVLLVDKNLLSVYPFDDPAWVTHSHTVGWYVTDDH